MKSKAISCMSGGYKSVFTQGVLTAFENSNFIVDAYASCSSSSIISAFASFQKIKDLDLSLWIEGNQIANLSGNSQSNAILNSINKLLPIIERNIFNRQNRYLVATSFVKTENAAQETQTEKSKRLGQKILIEAARNISTWKDTNLELHLFDTHASEKTKLLTHENLKEVLYATTRMLHAWHIPAYIDNKAYIDGSYTCLCPAIQLADLGYQQIICVTVEQNEAKLDLFSSENIPEKIGDTEICFVKPDFDLKELGVDFFKTTEEGIERAYLHGIEKGNDFINNYKNQ